MSSLGYAAAIAIAVLGSASLKARASHSHNGGHQLHIASIHGNNGTPTGPGDQDEEYCVQSYTSEVSSLSLANYIEQVLTKRPGQHWDGAASWLVDLWRTPKFCDQYTRTERGQIEIEYLVANAWPGVPLCGYSTYSCTVLSGPRMDVTGKHQHYAWAVIYFQSRHVRDLQERARNFINHETGHALGLADPRYAGDCEPSVMHNALYNCNQYAYVTYPTSRDIASVTRVANRQN